MSLASTIEALLAFLGLLRRFDRGDERAAQRLKTILPEKTFLRLVREREAALDRAKFGGR